MSVLGKLRLLFLLPFFFIGRKEFYARCMGVTLGSSCRILTKDFGSEPFLISIGDRVTVSSGVLFINHDGSTWLMRDELGRRQKFKRIVIGNDVFVGARSIIMPGVIIGNEVVVGAGSVVTRSIPSGFVVAGNPARIITTFSQLKARILAECPAQSNLPNPRNVVEFALAALIQEASPLLEIPERFVSASNGRVNEG